MSHKQFKQCSLLSAISFVIFFIMISSKPFQVNAVAAQELGVWSLYDQVAFQLRGISMLSHNDGWAVGFEEYSANGSEVGSVLLRWDGIAWNRATSPIASPLYAVKMISATDGWAVGKNGTRLHWNGNTWDNLSCSVINCVDLYAVDFTYANDVWSVGGSVSGTNLINGGIAHWDGVAWSQSSIYSQKIFRSLSAISANDVWAVGRTRDNAISSNRMLISHWNGLTWTELDSNTTTFGFSSVDMLSSSEGWAIGNGIISHYTGNWEHMGYPYPILVSLKMLSPVDGWIVGGTTSIASTSRGLILHWDGNAWSKIENPASKTLQSIDMLSANEGWAVGNDGVILRYTNYKQTYLPLIHR